MSGTPPLNNSSTGGFILEAPPKPPSGTDIERIVQVMVVQLSGIPGPLVRPRYQLMPPTQPDAATTWASVGINMLEADNFPSIVHDGTVILPGQTLPGADRMQRHGTVQVLITFYGPEAEDCAGSVRDALHHPLNVDPLTAAVGMKVREVHDLARVPEFINQQWIDRVDMMISFRIQIDRAYPVLNIDGADVDVHTDTAGGTTTSVSIRPNP